MLIYHKEFIKDLQLQAFINFKLLLKVYFLQDSLLMTFIFKKKRFINTEPITKQRSYLNINKYDKLFIRMYIYIKCFIKKIKS